jgi:hypothetical protein
MAAEVLNNRQRETLRSWNFIDHLASRREYYTQVIKLIQNTVRTLHVFLTDPADYLSILEPNLEDDPILNAYIESLQWIGEDTRPLFVALFARLLVSDIVEGVIGEIEERREGV